ncbi:hypothetical protein SESBI_35723 [Sesbania bispinosa]|nr:hypothetical protein SESBI_35723 [Sesbania bispinosa]
MSGIERGRNMTSGIGKGRLIRGSVQSGRRDVSHLRPSTTQGRKNNNVNLS